MKIIINKKEIANTLKYNREKNNISLKKLSESTKINRIVLMCYENNLIVPSIRNLVILCNYYKISLDRTLKYKII